MADLCPTDATASGQTSESANGEGVKSSSKSSLYQHLLIAKKRN